MSSATYNSYTSDGTYSDTDTDDSYAPPPPTGQAPAPPLEEYTGDDLSITSSSAYSAPSRKPPAPPANVAKRNMLGKSGGGLNRFKKAGKLVATLKAQEHDAVVRTEEKSMKDFSVLMEGQIKVYKKGGLFGKNKFVKKWVVLKANTARVSIIYYKTDKKPKNDEDKIQDIYKLEPPGIKVTSIDSKVLKAAGKNSQLCFQCTLANAGKDTIVAMVTDKYEVYEEWTKKIEVAVENVTQQLRKRSSAVGIDGKMKQTYQSNDKTLSHTDDNSEYDDTDTYTDTYTDTNTDTYTDTLASSKKSYNQTSPNRGMLAGSKSRMNDFVNVEGKDDAVDENTKINRKLKEQADLQKKKQKQQIDAGPSRVMVNAFEAKFTDAGLASTKAGLGKLIARAKLEMDPKGSGNVAHVEFERFCHAVHSEQEERKLSIRSAPLAKTTTALELKTSILKHIDSHHFAQVGVDWDTPHASKHANQEDRTRFAMALKRSNLLATVAQPDQDMDDTFGPENSLTPSSGVVPLPSSANLIDSTASVEEDWNTQYQSALKMPEKRYADAIKKGLRVHHLQRKVNKIAMIAARTIVDEYALPSSLKTIAPLDLEGDGGRGDDDDMDEDMGDGGENPSSGELMYVYRNLLIRLIKPSGSTGSAEEDAMYKIAGNELRGMTVMQSAATKAYQKALLLSAFNPDTQPLSLVLSVLVDYHGFRFLIMSMPPVDEQRTQVYGRLDTHDPNSFFEDNDAMFHGLHGAACDELNLKPHNIISGGESKLINGSVETQGHYCHDGRYYAMNFSRLMPSDLPNDGMEMLTKQLRPELVTTYRMPLSSDAFSSLTAPPKDDASATLISDSDQADIEVGNASRFLLTEHIPNFVSQLDLLKVFPYDSGTFTKAVHAAGINVRHIGRIAEMTRLPHVREMVVVEMLARTGKAILKRGHRRIIHKAKEAAEKVIMQKEEEVGTAKIDEELKQNLLSYTEHLNQDNVAHIVDFFNLMVGMPNDRENNDFWKHVLLPTLASKFNYNHSSASDPLNIDRVHICPMQLFHALQYHCGVRCATSNDYYFDGEAFPIKVANVVSVDAKCKYMKNEGLDINTVASMAEAEKERKRYLIALQGFRIRLFNLNNSSGLSVDLEMARTYNEMADMYCLDYIEGFSRDQTATASNNGNNANMASLGQEKDNVDFSISSSNSNDALDIALANTDKALSLVPSTHALATRIHETRMKIYFHKNDSQRMMQEFVAGMRAAVSHFGASGNHPFVCELHCVLGALFKKMGSINGAQDHLVKARDLAVKILGGSHTLLASYATQLAHVFNQSGDVDQAIVHHLQALQIHEAAFGSDSLQTANNAFYLGECYAERGNMPKAAELARRALEIRERALNDKVITRDNDDLLSSYYQMASMCVQNSEHAHAAHYYELVLDGLRKSSLQTETVLREIQRVTRDILNLRILTLTPIVMRRLQVIVNKHRPDKLLLAIAGNPNGSYELMEAMKEVIEKISIASPSRYMEVLVQEANLSLENHIADSDTTEAIAAIVNAEKCLACIVALTEQSQTK